MKSVLLDTNIILDLIGRRMPFYPATARLFSLGERQKVQLYTSSLSIASIAYILRKELTRDNLRKILSNLALLVDTLDLSGKIIELALAEKSFDDFEDSIQFFTARENNIDIIISRNHKDFKASTIPVMDCGQFVSSIK
ncbi:MAG: hypothetical protein A2W80_00920 [Candidatus Riflebacteria bacterium GWC2_50_8]|nr:MAG: hypothetical protein A2W80_00920 [Candidatus Riflebacteria bacterium GWC2_50_8]